MVGVQKRCFKYGCIGKKVLNLIHFRLHIAEALILTGQTPVRKRGRPSGENEIPVSIPAKRAAQIAPIIDVRFDKVGHFPEFVDEKNPSRCKNPGCSKRTFVKCIKCKINLCCGRNQNCFLQFHSN